jgi:hypothetical protein
VDVAGSRADADEDQLGRRIGTKAAPKWLGC